MTNERRLTAAEILRQRAEFWPGAATPAAHLMVRLLRLSDLALSASAHRMAAQDLTTTEFGVLSALRSVPFPHQLAPTELAAAVLITSGGLTKVLIALQQRGLIARPEGAADGRSKPARLTDPGRARVERAMADVLRADAELVGAAFSLADIDHMTGFAERLLAQLEPAGPSHHLERKRT